MDSSRFRTGIALRMAALFATFFLIVWMATHTHWYMSVALVSVAALAEIALFYQFATQSGREIARFLDAVAFDDTSQSFTGLTADSAYRELGQAMTQVIARLQSSRTQREEQARTLQTMLAHVPVALITIGLDGEIELLNMAARRLFERRITRADELGRHGQAFAAGIGALQPGNSAILRMERVSGPLQLKASVTDLTIRGEKRRIVSLQNIENELSAQELAAWQTVIRTMAHEVMNSLTPISSLVATTNDLVREARDSLPPDAPQAPILADASDALETVARRSEGLLHFVQNHRRLTKRLVTRPEVTPVRRRFAHVARLFGAELTARDIALETLVEPETLEVEADAELLDQALINLMRNAIEALDGSERRRTIRLSAARDADGHVVIAVADSGPGIALEQRDKVFVPFFTTKRQGSGVGLTLVRQIAAVHNATVDISETEGGGATIRLRF
ncbi:MAG TPA: ATP-binding protein [Rhizomicrobium sp.]|nr:ATP-binding protein [Rhizomicrobium sp.]